MRFSLLGLLILAAPAFGQTSFPMVTHALPTAIQRGTTAEITVEAQTDLTGAYQVLFEGRGLSAEVIKPKVDPAAKPGIVKSVKLKVTATADAPLGVREFRIASELGLSSLGQLLVTADPVVTETTGINTPAKAMAVPLPAVICGRIEIAENVDYYRIKAKAGQQITLEVFCARIQDKIHDLQKHADPLVRIFDKEGRELAAADDDFFADPLLTFRVPTDGDYTIEIRDAKYDGDPRWSYALAVTDRPYASQVFPFAMPPGKAVEVEPTGSARQVAPRFTLTAPTEPGLHAIPLPASQGATVVPVLVTPLPLINEVEPNDTPKQATRLTIPGGVNARIQQKRDLDHFVFTGTKGKAVRLEVFARRFGTLLKSRVDAAMDILNAAGAIVASNDDATGKDPMLIFTPPADGDYVIRIRDLNNKGGDGFAYYLEADLARPDFTLKCDPSKAMIGPGSRTAWYVQVTRTNGFTGPVTIAIEGLPAGVTASLLTIPATMTQGCVVLTAAADAKIGVGVVRVVGTAEVPNEQGKAATVRRVAAPVEEIYFPGGGRGRFDVGMQAVAVTRPSDVLEVSVTPNKISLKPGQEVTLTVNVKRRGDYDKTMTLNVVLEHLGTIFGNPLPPGVTIVEGKSKTLLGTGSAGTITLKAAADAAECKDVPISVQAYVPINFVVKIGYSSEPIRISVTK